MRNALVLLLVSASLTACSTKTTEPGDPFEAFNRSAYAATKVADTYVLKPVAKGYDAVTPKVVQNRVSDFFGNLDDVVTLTNDLLQLKFEAAGIDLSRLLINTTVGIGGLFDVATRAGITANDEDFGQTMGYWGVPSGPFIMVPFFGPKTLRSLTGDVAEVYSTSDWVEFDRVRVQNSLRGLEIIDDRVSLFPIESNLEDSLDEYATVRDAYLQRREYLVYDGEVPESDDDELWEDECEDEDDEDDEECEDIE